MTLEKGIEMGLFGRKKEKKACCEIEIVEETDGTDASCGCGGECAGATVVTVMGPGCKRCHELNENAERLAQELGGSIRIDYVTDPAAMAEAGVMSTPALLVNGKVVSQGKVLSTEEIKALL